MNPSGICCNRQDIYNYFPPVDMVSFCLSVSMSGPRMQRCVCARRWKFWFVQFWTWWLMSVDCGSRSVFRGRQCVRHFSCIFLFLFFSSSEEVIRPKRLNYLTYIWAEMEEPGAEPTEIFICSPRCMPGCMAVSSCRLRALIKSDSLSRRMFGLLVSS